MTERKDLKERIEKTQGTNRELMHVSLAIQEILELLQHQSDMGNHSSLSSG